MGPILLLAILACLGIGALVELHKLLFRKSPPPEPVQPKLHVVQAGDMLLFDARAIPRELVFNHNLFRISERQMRNLPAVTAHIWIFSEAVLRELAQLPTPAPLLWHLNDGRRGGHLNYLYARKGLLSEAEEAKMQPHAEVTWSVDLISATGKMTLEQLLAAARAQTVS